MRGPAAGPAKAIAAVATGLWIASAVPGWVRFRRALADPGAAQRRVLEGLLRAGADSSFGREHGLASVRTLEDLQRAVPVRDYDALAPWITRAASGEADVLTSDAIDRFEPSSGSTAARKLLPSTARLRAEMNAAIEPWVVDLYRRRPALAGGPSYWSISPVVRHERTAGGHPVGFEEDSAYLGGFAKRLVDRAMAVPGGVRALPLEEFWRATCVSLLACGELRLISVWSPSFLTLLLARCRSGWDELVRDIPLERKRALERAGPLDTRAIWPRLGLISTWTDAAAAGDLPAVRADFPGVEIQPKGLVATEGFVSLPFGGGRPFAVGSHLIEIERDDGSIVGVDTLREGDEGAVILTTGAGLWRYRLGDRIRVEGFVDRTPSVRFLGRQDRVSDLRGEKLNEAFVAGILARLGLAERFAMLAPEAEPLRYVLYTDGRVNPAALEAALAENPHYAWCREVGQLARVEVARVGPGARAAYVDACRRAGQRLGDIKPAVLGVETGWGAKIAAAGHR